MVNYNKFKKLFPSWVIKRLQKLGMNKEELKWPDRQLYTLLEGYPTDMTSNEFIKADRLNNLGWACHGMQNYREALEYYDQALALCKDFPMIWNNKGLAHFRLHDFANAERAYHQAIKFNSQFIKPYSNLGILHFELGNDAEEAVRWFKKALALDPNYQRAKEYLFRIEHDL